MDDLPALDLWDVVTEVLHSANTYQYGETHGETKPKRNTNTKTEKHVNRDDDELLSVERVVTNAKPSHFEAMLYIFEVNEAVIKMLILFPQTSNFRIEKLCCMCLKTTKAVIKIIIKGRSPTMGHVSRTHRVALDMLFDRINLDPKIQIKHVDTKSQLADMLTKGNFTRDEWHHLSPFIQHHEFVDVLLQHFSPINNP